MSDINFKITDVGGEREERAQWIDFLSVFFNNVHYRTHKRTQLTICYVRTEWEISRPVTELADLTKKTDYTNIN